MTKNDSLTYALWTGGWDSSYRMVELSRKNMTIQPIYVYGDGRISEQYERRAMESILTSLRNKQETKAEIKPINFIQLDTIPENSEISASYGKLTSENAIGSQYEWLARLALEYPGLEVGIEKTPAHSSAAVAVIEKYGKMVYDSDLETYVIDNKNSTKELSDVFGRFSFPIIDKDGATMKNNIAEWGYKDVMKDVWVCHSPIFGKPCGYCNPCKLKINTDMEFLMAPSSLRRYKNRDKTFFKYFYAAEKKLTRQIDKIRFS